MPKQAYRTLYQTVHQTLRVVQNTSQTYLDILRHGEHVLGDVICGVTDPELSEKGWGQLQAQCRRLRDEGNNWDICITSPRKRCAQFAQTIARDLGIECLVDRGFAEVDFGAWEALSFAEINNGFPGQWQEWIGFPEQLAPHGGEKYGDFLDRVDQSILNLVSQYWGKRILLLAHGGVVRAIFYSVLGLRPGSLSRFSVPHACHSRIMAYHSKGHKDWYQLDRHNT